MLLSTEKSTRAGMVPILWAGNDNNEKSSRVIEVKLGIGAIFEGRNRLPMLVLPRNKIFFGGGVHDRCSMRTRNFDSNISWHVKKSVRNVPCLTRNGCHTRNAQFL